MNGGTGRLKIILKRKDSFLLSIHRVPSQAIAQVLSQENKSGNLFSRDVLLLFLDGGSGSPDPYIPQSG